MLHQIEIYILYALKEEAGLEILDDSRSQERTEIFDGALKRRTSAGQSLS